MMKIKEKNRFAVLALSLVWFLFICLIPSLVTAEQVQIDVGVWIELQTSAVNGTRVGPLSADLTGVNIGIDLTHNDGGRQVMVQTIYTTVQGDLTSRGATITFVSTGPLTLSLLQNYDAFWIEEDWSSTFSSSEKTALMDYVSEGGCLFLNGDEHGIFSADPGGIIALFDIPYANTGGSSGTTTDITEHCLTQGVSVVNIPGATNSLAPVSPAYDIIRDSSGKKMVAVNEIGSGRVIVFSDEITFNSYINSCDNRILANNVFDYCLCGLEITVAFDIKPGSCPNPLNIKSKGVLPVAILGTEDFDVTTIDPTTIVLTREGYEDSGVAALRWSYEDVASPYEGELCECHDLYNDGYPDLTLKFKTQELVSLLYLQGVKGQTIPLIITGNLKEEENGTPIRGSDCVRVK